VRACVWRRVQSMAAAAERRRMDAEQERISAELKMQACESRALSSEADDGTIAVALDA
jgi:hypothetical protein